MTRTLQNIVQISVLLSATFAFDKEWKWKNQWNIGEYWDGGKPPCPNDVVVISDGTIFVDNNVTAGGLEFGNNGEIVLEDDSEIVLGGDVQSLGQPEHCGVAASESTFIGQTTSKDFMNPMNWDIRRDGVVNEDLTMAAPYINKIPCTEDTIIFPMSNTFKVKVMKNWQVKDVMINKQILSNAELQTYIQQNTDEFTLSGGGSLSIDKNVPCTRGGCQCGYQKFKDDICNSFTCHVATVESGCTSVVRPHSDCCDRCGKLMTFDVLDTYDFQKCWAVYELRLNQEVHAEARKYVKFYMTRINGQQLQITLTEVESTLLVSATATSLAIETLKKIITNTNDICSGTNLIIDSGRRPGSGRNTGGGGGTEDNSSDDKGLKIALGIIIPLLILVVIIIIVFAYRRRRTPYDVPKVRFKNHGEMDYPGGAEGQYSTMGNTNLAIDIEENRTFANPAYTTHDDIDHGNVRKHEMREFPYEIPLDDEPPPSYTEKDYNLGVTTVGNVNDLYAQVHKDDDEKKEKVDFDDDDISSIHKEPLDEEEDFLKDDDISQPPPFEKSLMKNDRYGH